MQLDSCFDKVKRKGFGQKRRSQIPWECHLSVCTIHLVYLLRQYFVNHDAGSQFDVMVGKVVFAGVVSPVGAAFGPKESEETLRLATFEPLETHVV